VDIEKNDKIAAFSNALKATGANLKLVDIAKIHVTLKFLGETKDEHMPKIKEIMAEGVKNIAPFEIELRGTGSFPSLKYIKVVWVGARNAERLADIASYLNDELQTLGYKKEKRGFSTHITLARVKSARNLGPVQALLKERREDLFGTQAVDRIILKKSVLTPKGPIYSVVEEVKLGE